MSQTMLTTQDIADRLGISRRYASALIALSTAANPATYTDLVRRLL